MAISEIIAVQRKFDGKWNFIKDGRIISDEWFRNAWNFCDGTARVQREDGTWCLINENGKIVGKCL